MLAQVTGFISKLDTANKQVQGNSEKTLLVARLSHDTTEGGLSK